MVLQNINTYNKLLYNNTCFNILLLIEVPIDRNSQYSPENSI